MKYKINKPVKFTDHFLLYEDKTSWDGEYIKTKNGNFPSYLDKYREQNITNYKNYIKATTKYAQQYCFSGVYIIFFCELKMYYVGIATENIVDRLSKHIVKVFGSYLGQGINHTNENKKGWRFLAKEILNKNKNYKLEDCYLVTINPSKIDVIDGSYKDKLKYLENQLSYENNNLIKLIIQTISNNTLNTNWRSFNKKDNGLKHEYELLHWQQND